MPDILAAEIAYGPYISIFKLIIYIAMLFVWMLLTNWINTDAQSVRTRASFWTNIITIVGGAGLVIWLFAPLFVIGLILYVVAVGTAAIVYVMHRNSLVPDFEKVLTADHIKSLFVNEEKKMARTSKGISLVTANGNDVPIPKPKDPESIGFGLVCEIFEDAVWKRADEILFQPVGDECKITYRIDGASSSQEPKSREDMEHFMHYMKQLTDLDVKEKRKPQKGGFTLRKGEKDFKWEIRTAGSTVGEQALAKRMGTFNIMRTSEIGMTSEQIKNLEKVCELKKGLFIISGPKKTGVTTTLYAILKNHDPFMNDINTVEKRPAGEVENITQHLYSMSDTGTTTYDIKLRSISRMGPNIMGVGDCEDSKTGIECMRAIQDDKLLYVTIEAASSVTALGRWLKYVPNKDDVLDNLVGICNQRMVRKLCEECKQGYQPNPQLLKKFNLSPEKAKVLFREAEIEYDKHGRPLLCEKCQGTGFYGRTGIFEVIILNDELRQAVKKAKSLQEIGSLFRHSGMVYLQEKAMEKVTDGTTSINEVIRELSSGKKTVKKKKLK